MRSKRIAASVMAAALCLGTALPYSAAAEVNIRPAADQQTNKRDTANEAYSVGDVDGNGTITGVDASKVLSDYAVTSVGGKSELSDRAKKAADVDRNGVINGVDASKILGYYAFCSAGGELTFPEFLLPDNGKIAASTPAVSSTAAAASTTSTTTASVTTPSNKVNNIKLSKTSMQLTVGQGDISIVTMEPASAVNKAEKWESSDTSVATVDNEGYVIARKAGTCTITVTSVDNPAVKADIKVTVGAVNVTTSPVSTTTSTTTTSTSSTTTTTTVPATKTSTKTSVSSSTTTSTKASASTTSTTAPAKTTTSTTTAAITETTVSTTVVSSLSNISKTNFTIRRISGVTYVGGILVVNKNYGLPESYNSSNELNFTAKAQFERLAADAKAQGLNIYMSSGYRSYATQSSIYQDNVKKYGEAIADSFSARPGHSEHQTGLAIDVNTIDDTFAGTPEAIWLADHAHEYGLNGDSSPRSRSHTLPATVTLRSKPCSARLWVC